MFNCTSSFVVNSFVFSKDASNPDIYWSMDTITEWLRPDIGNVMYSARLSELNVGESRGSSTLRRIAYVHATCKS